jgi:RNA polymerase sigma factor (sigma-70 family)
MHSDARLIADARDDPEAFRELYKRYAEAVLGYFIRRTGDVESAHDLTAETFAQAWIVRGRFRDEAGGNAGPWLFGIARNVLLMSVRRGRLERQASERLGIRERLDDPATTAVPTEEWAHDADDADRLLDLLPPLQREAVRLRVIEGLDYAEVAADLGTSAPTARVRVHRGLAALRNRLNLSPETTA